MVQFFCALFLASFVHAAPAEVSGTVTAAPGVTLKTGGVLFIFAKEAGKPMPVAVLRVPDPKLPFKFNLSGKNAMVAGTPFIGPFQIVARYTATGDAMDKSGPEGVTSDPVPLGKTDLKIELKSK
jgi:cytochrome c-type biogenesis protein CcmH